MHTIVVDNVSEDSDKVDEQDETKQVLKPFESVSPVAMKTPSVATYKIIKQGEKGVYQIVRENGTDIVYINFGAMLKSISRGYLTIVVQDRMNRYGWMGLRIIIRRDSGNGVHCLNLESMDVYLLSDRKYPLSAEFTMSNQHKDWLVQEQTALGKDFSNPFYG
ncbi:hypothetical protein Tco_1449706 [Tanacetum coccineum]